MGTPRYLLSLYQFRATANRAETTRVERSALLAFGCLCWHDASSPGSNHSSCRLEDDAKKREARTNISSMNQHHQHHRQWQLLLVLATASIDHQQRCSRCPSLSPSLSQPGAASSSSSRGGSSGRAIIRFDEKRCFVSTAIRQHSSLENLPPPPSNHGQCQDY